MFAAQLQEALVEAQGGGKLSGVKKKPAPHMWFIAKTGKNAWVVSIGDPTKTSSKVKRTFHSKDDLRYWAKHEKEVSDDHIIDRSGLKLVPDYYSQWYVDNMLREGTELNRAFEAIVNDQEQLDEIFGGLFGPQTYQRFSLLKHRLFGLFTTKVDKPNKMNPPVATGNLPDLEKEAKQRGWIWKPDKSLFGGHWLSKKDKNTYEYDLV